MKLGAVLPLSIRGSYDIDDLNRADILFHSLTTFAESGLFDPFLVVTPHHEVEIVRRHFERWQHLGLEVISEEELAPELAEPRHRKVRGWRKQQIVKLAAARKIHQTFYITFDADIICTRPVSSRDLVIDGRALMQYEECSLHPKWWKSSARILGINKRAFRNFPNPGRGMSVTPAIMSTQIAASIGDSITIKGEGSWVDKLCSLHDNRKLSNLNLNAYRMRKWTEYSLYYLHALKTNQLNHFHISAGTEQVPHKLFAHDATPLKDWDAAKMFSPKSNWFFTLIGSKSMVSPKAVWEKVGPHISGAANLDEIHTPTREHNQC